MGYQELIESLKEKAKERIEALRKDGEQEIEKYREKALSEFEKFRIEYLNHVRQVEESEVSSLVLEAKKQAGIIRNMTMHRLAERIYNIARESLLSLRKEGYEDFFENIVRELPPMRWSRIKVNPLDRKLAEVYFPDVEIVEDASIIGGLVAESTEGITVDNTFIKRLERLWPEILPEILREIKIEKGISY
ncbi:MAG: V-type ATP synthase subunit E [Thermodesulfovibrionales bacterium]|nr:V-type ATP synthase subunit E [Thermodesulfovibrionales bacterium]